jgi:hypothetical protein
VSLWRAWWPSIALAAVAVFAAAFVVHYGLSAHDLQPDEFDTVLGGRDFDRSFLHTLFAISPVGRGPERLAALVFALPNALFNDTATVFRVAHVLLGLVYLSAAIPVYALARGLGLERWQALFPTAGAVLTPWLLYGGTLLNVTVAYPTAMALAWATWRAVVRPGLRTDALVLLFGVLGAMARESHVGFLAASALAVLVQTWRDRPAGESLRDGLRAYPGRVVRSHPLLVGAAAALLIPIFVFGTHRLLGSSYEATSISNPVTLRSVLDAAWAAASELTMGTGYLPMIIALPWLAHELLRPRSRETGAFAVIAFGMFAAFIAMVVYFTATTTGIGDAERYVAVLAGLPPLAAALALFRREVGPLSAAVSGLLLARAIATQGLYSSTAPYDYFLAPARLFFTVVMQGQLSGRLPFSDHHIATTLLLAIVAAAAAIMFLRHHPGRLGRAGVAACAALALGVSVALGAVSGIYIADKFEALDTSPALSFDEQTFVDAATGLKPVALWDYAPGADPRIPYEAEQAEFFNRSFQATLHLAGMPRTVDVARNITATVDPRTGQLRTTSALPAYLLEPIRFTRVGFDARIVAGPSTVFGPLPFALARFNGRPRVAWTVTGTEDEGWILAPGHGATIRLFPTARPSCWQTDVLTPPVVSSPIRFDVTGPGLHQSGTLGASSAAVLHLHSPTGAPSAIRVEVRGAGKLASGLAVVAAIYTFTPEACAN